MDILQWNINGFYRRLEYIKIIIKQTNPTCICFQETNFSSKFCGTLAGYQNYYKNRENHTLRASGGVAIFVKSHTLPEEVALNTKIEAVAVRLNFPVKLTLCNIYLPNSNSLVISDLNKLISQLPQPFIILGDYNSHHYYWGSSKCDTRGKMVANWLDSHDDLVLLNSNQPTYFCSQTGNSSNIDLSISSQNIAPYFDWHVLEDLYGSDHYPIFLKSHLNSDKQNSLNIPKKWKLKFANWPYFQDEVKNKLCHLTKLSENLMPIDINKVISEFTYMLQESANKSIPKTSGKINSKAVPWWNDECKIAIKEAKKALKIYKKNAGKDHDSKLKIDYKKKRSKARRILKESRKTYWMNYVASINSGTPVSEVWRKIKSVNCSNLRKDTIVLEISKDKLSSDPVKTSNCLASTFAANSSSTNYDLNFLTYINKHENENFDLIDNSNPINSKILMQELLQVLSKIGNTSPGPDEIPNAIIKNLPDSGLEYLLDLYNYIWCNQVFPEKWREAIVIPILKPGKLPTSPFNFRPISLTCNICKILEKIIAKRIRWYLESKNVLSQFQYGFRQSRSTLDLLMRLEDEILTSFADKNLVVAVALDIEKAYEMVRQNRVLRIMEQNNIKGNCLAFAKNLLSDRIIKVRIGNVLSDPFKMENGLPQGSVISVILFLIAINDIFSSIQRPVKGFLFADDLTIICCGNNIEPTTTLIQSTLEKLHNWSNRSGFKFSQSKSEYIVFSRKRIKDINAISLTINNQPIKQVNCIKLLGIYFDSKLNWKYNIKTLKSDCNKRMNVIKTLSSTSWGSDRKCLHRTYKALIRQKIDYGSIIYDSADKKSLKSLETIQNTALRLSIGAFKTSPIDSILAEAEESPLYIRRKELCINYAAKILARPKTPVCEYYCRKRLSDSEFEVNKNLPQPFRIRVNKYVNETNITIPPMRTSSSLYFPPWQEIRFPINLDLSDYIRDNTPECIYKRIFYELANNKYGNYKSFYTDGSCIMERSGCAILYDNKFYKFRLPDLTSIFVCEATAILKSLQIISNKSNEHSYVIYTDSKSCLMALNNFLSDDPLIKEVQQLMVKLQSSQYDFILVWIPSHQGIRGNEKVDIEAKNATNIANEVDKTFKWSLSDFKRYLIKEVKKEWNCIWSKNDKYINKVRLSVFEKTPIPTTSRKDQSVLSRLRIGHTNLTHIHLITKCERNKCTKCNMNLTIPHLLIECDGYTVERSIFNIEGNLKDILSFDRYNSVFKFLKHLNIYNKI